MPLSYAGVGLSLSVPALEQRLSEIQPFDAFDYFSGWSFDGFDLQDLPTPAWPQAPKLAPGVLHWPTGAVRPAWFFEVVGKVKADQIRAAVGDPMTPKPLVLNDSRTGKTITVPMYLLPFRPISQFESADPVKQNGLILTLTDARFYWQWRRGDITTRPASWTSLIASLAGFLGATISPDSVDTRYGQPTTKWIGYQRPTAAVLDAALTQIGHRLVANLNGTFKTVRYTTAKAASDAQIAANGVVISGGLLDDADIARYVPSAVKVSFASGVQVPQALPTCAPGLALQPAPYEVTKTLVSLGLTTLYGTSTGLAGASAPIYADFVYDGTNATAAANYATVAAQDWYGWRLPDADLVFPGTEPWAPTGWEDVIEWTYQRREAAPYASTLLRRGPWDQFVSGSWRSGLLPAPCPGPGQPGGPVTTAACGWIWGLYGIECFSAAVPILTTPPYVTPAGSCVCINTAQGPIQLYPVGNGVLQWQSVKKFNTCRGSGTLFLDLTNKCCPQLILQGVVPAVGSGPPTDYPMELLGCGQDSMGNRIVDFGGGGPLVCSSHPIVTGCSACPSGAPKIWRFVLQSARCVTLPDGEYKVTYFSGCTWTGGWTSGLGGTINLVFSGGTATLTFSNGLTYSGAVSCTALTLTKTANGDCASAPTTLNLCPAQDPCSDNTFILRLTCQQCTLVAPVCCPSVNLPPSITLALSTHSLSQSVIYFHVGLTIQSTGYPLDCSAWAGSYVLSLSEDSLGNPYYGALVTKCGTTYGINVQCAGSGSFLYYHDPVQMGDPVTINGTLWQVEINWVSGPTPPCSGTALFTGYVLQASCSPLGGTVGQISGATAVVHWAPTITPCAITDGGPVLPFPCTSASGATYSNPLPGDPGTTNIDYAEAFVWLNAAITSGGGPC